MEQQQWDGILFADSISGYDFTRYYDHILHILCTEGSISFVFHNVRYNVVPGDYVILTNSSLASSFSESSDFKAIIMSISEPFVTSMALRSNYGIIGHLSLLQNPVMRLNASEFKKCREDLNRIRERLKDEKHLFREELLGHLLMAHILDLYDIHARGQDAWQVPERAMHHLLQFVDLLYKGEFIEHRDLSYYASRLFITPHYLSEISKKISGKPATFWIDHFLLRETMRLLREKEHPLTEIADRLNFSSLSYFSRYVQKRMGVSPSDYRSRL